MKNFNLTSLALAASLLISASAASAFGGGNGGWNNNSSHHDNNSGGWHGGGWNNGHDNHNDHNDHNDHGNDDKWYSDYYHRWFYKSGDCSQYSYTDHDTCNTGRDYLQCDYDSSSQSCYSSHH